jgi:hypothetical protein
MATEVSPKTIAYPDEDRLPQGTSHLLIFRLHFHLVDFYHLIRHHYHRWFLSEQKSIFWYILFEKKTIALPNKSVVTVVIILVLVVAAFALHHSHGEILSSRFDVQYFDFVMKAY